MKNSEKAAAVRIFSDLIKADRIIDTGEMVFYDSMRRKYSFSKDNEVEAMSMSFAGAVSVLRNSDENLHSEILADCANATISDGFCAHSEALLLIALRETLSNDGFEYVDVVSIPKRTFSVDDATVLYVESKFDDGINRSIVESYRTIYKEFLFAGFHFVYIPNIISHYKKTDKILLKDMISFLAPSFSEVDIMNVISGIEIATTENFCKDILCNRLGLEDMRDINPSLLIKIGNNYVGDAEYSNFLRIEIVDDFTRFVNQFVDEFSSMLSSDTLTVPIGKEANNQYLYYGFYKQLLDIFLNRKNVRSRIVIDLNKEDILLPDINQKLSGLSRKDKALYVLFLIMKNDNGFSFNLPKSRRQMDSYNEKMNTLQERYRIVYGLMGGDRNRAPDVRQAELRRPMLSHIKRSICALSEMLYNVNDYQITKNAFGIFNVGIESSMVYVEDWKSNDLVALNQSDLYAKVIG